MLELELPEALIADLLSILQQHSDGITEHGLLKQLHAQGYHLFEPSLEPLALFQAHFLLFHILYRHQDTWQQQGFGKLRITCMNIGFDQNSATQYGTNIDPESSPHPCHDDSLRRYYLDFAAYRDTQTQDVIELLDNFWRKLGGQYDRNDIEQAKLTLELPLDQPLNRQQINQHYRRLSFSHHPDRGGDTAKFQQLNQAIQTLRAVYSD